MICQRKEEKKHQERSTFKKSANQSGNMEFDFMLVDIFIKMNTYNNIFLSA